MSDIITECLVHGIIDREPMSWSKLKENIKEVKSEQDHLYIVTRDMVE